MACLGSQAGLSHMIISKQDVQKLVRKLKQTNKRTEAEMHWEKKRLRIMKNWRPLLSSPADKQERKSGAGMGTHNANGNPRESYILPWILPLSLTFIQYTFARQFLLGSD